MPHRQRKRHPNMPVEIFLVGRSRRRVVMDVGPFDFRTIAFGGRVVDDHQQPIGKRQRPQEQKQQLGGNRFGLASEWCQKVIIVLEVGADSGGSQPGGHGSPSVGEEDARQQHRQPPTVSGVPVPSPATGPTRPNRPDTANDISNPPSLALLSLASCKTPCDGRAFFIARSIVNGLRPSSQKVGWETSIGDFALLRLKWEA